MLAFAKIPAYAYKSRRRPHHMSERTRYARPESEGRCHCTELRKASRRISQLYDTALAPSGLKTTQRAILAEIGRSEPTTGGGLAQPAEQSAPLGTVQAP